MRKYSGDVGCAVVALLCLAPAWGMRDMQISDRELEPDASHKQVTHLILKVLDESHYLDTEVDDVLSRKLLDAYLKSLDPNRMFFVRADVDEFQRLYGTHLDDQLLRGDVRAPYRIFKRFRQRMDGRIDRALELTGSTFDFSLDEEYLFDRAEMPWAVDSDELDAIWRQRIKNEVLSLRLAGKDPDAIAETLQKRYAGIRRSTFQLDRGDVYDSFINAFTSTIDPHTAYLSPKLSEDFDINMRLSLEGIGAVLQSENNEYTVIQRLVPGGTCGRQQAAASGGSHHRCGPGEGGCD